MSKPIVYVIPNKGCAPNVTAGKRYKVVYSAESADYFSIIDDNSTLIWCRWTNSPTCNGDWKCVEVLPRKKKSEEEKLLRELLACFVLGKFEQGEFLEFRGQRFNKLPEVSLRKLIKIRKQMK